jgi:hypothetical protein
LRCARRCGGRAGDRRAQGCPFHRLVRLHVHPTSAIAASAPERQSGGPYNRLPYGSGHLAVEARNGRAVEGRLGLAPISSRRA